MSISKSKQRLAFRSLYPNVVELTQMSDKEIDYFLSHQIYSYRLYVAEQLCSRSITGLCNFKSYYNAWIDVVYSLLLDNAVLPF